VLAQHLAENARRSRRRHAPLAVRDDLSTGRTRSLALGALGGARLLARYDWLYGWTPA